MCDKRPYTVCNCRDYLLPDYDRCQPVTCHNASICILRRLLDEPMSSNCYEQHLFYLNDYIKSCKDGFYVTDLLHLSRILEIIANKDKTIVIYREHLKQLLQLAALPPKIHNVSEELTEAINFSEYMTILGFLGIWLCEPNLRFLSYRAIKDLITKKETNLSVSKLSFRYEVVQMSYLPEIFVQLLQLSPFEEYYVLLETTLILSDISPTICQKMVAVNAIDYLLMRLIPNENEIGEEMIINVKHTNNYLKYFHITCQILINLVANLNGLDEKSLTIFTPSINSMWAIRYIFRGLVYGTDSQLPRNNLLTFLLLCLDIFPYIEITECYLLDDLVLLSVATEVESDTWVKDIVFTNSELDISFKKLLILSLSFAWKYPRFRLIFEYRNIIPGLLKIIATEYETDWHSEEHELLIRYTLISIYFIAPQLIDIFVDCNGIHSLLIMIETYTLLATDRNRFKLEETLKVLTVLTESKNEKVIDAIKCNCGISVICMMCDCLLGKDVINSSDQDVLSYAFHILCFLYEMPIIIDPALYVLHRYFKRVVKPNHSDSCLNPRTVISAIYLLWEIITCDDNKLRDFIKMEGIYLLLDIIDTNTFPVKIIGLGCLVDICEDVFCVPFLLTWRGGEDKKRIFSSLLANTFREECTKIGVRLNDNDIIIDTHYPLMGKLQYLQTISTDSDCHSYSVIADMLCSSRPKIYALLQILNTRYEENVELVNEHYKISNIPISSKDKIILHLAKNFFALKLSEAWHELYQDIIASNIEPVEIDAQMLIVLTEEMKRWNESVKSEQEAILGSELYKEEVKEYNLYNILKTCRLQNAIDALRELKYLARTSDRMFRLAHKEKQKTEVEESLMKVGRDMKIIRTYKKDLNITYIYHQNYHVKHNLPEKDQVFCE